MIHSNIICLFIATAMASELRITNRCSFTVWPGLLGNPGKAIPENGGFKLAPGKTKSLQVSNDWAGRVWGRTNCNSAGHCETGDCGNKIQCKGAGGVPPATLAEITLKGSGGHDFYDISLVDGFNLMMKMVPIPGTYTKTGGSKYDCTTDGCSSNLNSLCPKELAVYNKSGKVIACMNACEKFKTDEYCCRGKYSTPEKCQKPKDYYKIFKTACPNAYAYAYDDPNSTFTCKGSPNAGYEITFC